MKSQIDQNQLEDVSKIEYLEQKLNSAMEANDIKAVQNVLNHPDYTKQVLHNTGLTNVLKESPDIAVLLIESGIELYAFQQSPHVSYMQYAIANKLDNVIDALLKRDDLKFRHSSGMDSREKPKSLIAWAMHYENEKLVNDFLAHKNYILTERDITLLNKHMDDNPAIQLVINKDFCKKLIAKVDLGVAISFLEKIDFDVASTFSDGSTIPHLMLQRWDKDAEDVASVMDYLLNRNDKNSNSLLNVNIKNAQGERVIDIVAAKDYSTAKMQLVKVLRGYGSVEPKEPIAFKNVLPKLEIRSDTAPDSIVANKAKAEQILKLMYEIYNLDNKQIEEAIEWFKASADLTSEDNKAEWGSDAKNVAEVVLKLSEMTHVTDRLTVSWNFKKVLGTIIHITKQEKELQESLIDTLRQIKMCDLSKLMNLLYVVQDKIVDAPDIDYSKKSINDFPEILASVYNVINITYNDKAPLAIFKWFSDNLDKVKVTDPEKWCGYTQKIQGIFNKAMINNGEYIYKDSYHYNEGLQSKVINPLLELLIIEDSKYVLIKDWKIAKEEGKVLQIEETFNKIVSGSIELDTLQTMIYSAEMANGDLESISVEMLKKYCNLIHTKKGYNEAQRFIKILTRDCTFSNEGELFLNEWPKATDENNNVFITNDNDVANITCPYTQDIELNGENAGQLPDYN